MHTKTDERLVYIIGVINEIIWRIHKASKIKIFEAFI